MEGVVLGVFWVLFVCAIDGFVCLLRSRLCFLDSTRSRDGWFLRNCKTQDAQTRRVCSVLRMGGVGGRSSPAKARRERARQRLLRTSAEREVRSLLLLKSAFRRNAQQTC